MIEAFLSAVALASFAGFITWRNNRITRFAAASATFRAAFNDSLLRLIASHDATSTIVFQNHNAHLAAILAFQPYVSRYKQGSFDIAAKEYSLQANIQQAKGPLEALLFDGSPEAQEQRAALLKAVQNLLTYAAET